MQFAPDIVSVKDSYISEDVVDMLDSSDESEIDEDPEFRLPHQSDSEHGEPYEGKFTTLNALPSHVALIRVALKMRRT